MSFASFHEQAISQGVSLPSDIVEAARNPELLGPYCFAATDMLAAIAATGHRLRRNPGVPLIERSLSNEDDTFGTAGAILRAMLNASLEPIGDSGAPTFTYAERVPTISACDRADLRIGTILSFLTDPAIAGDTHAQVITSGGKPVFVRKSTLGHPSAVNTRDIVLNGIPVPAGTLLRVDTIYDTPRQPMSAEERRLWPDTPPEELLGNELPSGYTTCDISSVTRVGFGRFSAFVLPPDERSGLFAHFTDEDARYEPGLAACFYGQSIHSIADAIEQTLPSARMLGDSH